MISFFICQTNEEKYTFLDEHLATWKDVESTHRCMEGGVGGGGIAYFQRWQLNLSFQPHPLPPHLTPEMTGLGTKLNSFQPPPPPPPNPFNLTPEMTGLGTKLNSFHPPPITPEMTGLGTKLNSFHPPITPEMTGLGTKLNSFHPPPSPQRWQGWELSWILLSTNPPPAPNLTPEMTGLGTKLNSSFQQSCTHSYTQHHMYVCLTTADTAQSVSSIPCQQCAWSAVSRRRRTALSSAPVCTGGCRSCCSCPSSALLCSATCWTNTHTMHTHTHTHTHTHKYTTYTFSLLHVLGTLAANKEKHLAPCLKDTKNPLHKCSYLSESSNATIIIITIIINS